MNDPGTDAETAAVTKTNQAMESPAQPARSSRRAAVWITVVVTLLLGMVCLSVAGMMFKALASYKQEPPREEPDAKLLRVEVFEIEATDIDEYVWGFGTVQADREVIVSAEVGGRITEIDNLEVGQKVAAPSINIDSNGQSQRSQGDVLVRIDPQTYSERVKQAEAAIEQDTIALKRLDTEHATNQQLIEQQKRRLATIQAEYDRQERLVERGAGVASTLDRTRLELEQYKEAMIRLEQSLELYPIQRQELLTRKSAHTNDLKIAQLELDKATVYPPFSGMLSEVFIEQGKYVRPGEQLVQITDLEHVEVAVPLSLSDAALLEKLLDNGTFPTAELAQQEDHFLSNDPDQRWHGVVRRIDPIADEKTRTVQAFVEVDNAQQTTPLRPGTFVFSRIEAGRIPATRGRLLPRDAIVDGAVFLVKKAHGNDGEESSEEDGVTVQQAVRTPVTILDTFQTFVLIEETLAPQEQIVMTNLDIVRDGSLLDVRQKHTLKDEFTRLRVPYLERVAP